jgi:hypothetical protein
VKEGYWVNYRNGKKFPVSEHETWIREPGNAKKLGVPPGVVAMFKNFEPREDRDKFLLFLMQNAPIMRIRGHGNSASFEYSSSSRADPIEAIEAWGNQEAGPFTELVINNFATRENTVVRWEEFERLMSEEGPEGVMRAASTKFAMKRGIIKELLALSKEILG